VIKALIAFRRRPGMPLVAFHEHWRMRHADLIARLPGIRRYVQNFPLDMDPPFDALAESTFDNSRAMKALAASAEYADVVADERYFIDAASLTTVVAEEHVIADGPVPAAACKLVAFVRRPAATPVDDFFRDLAANGKRSANTDAVCRYVQCHARRSIYEAGRTPAYDAFEMIWFETRAAAASYAARPVMQSALVTERVVVG